MPQPITNFYYLVKEKKIPPISLFYGEEEYFIEKNIEFSKKIIVNELKYSFKVYYSTEANILEIISDIDEFGMFAEKKVIVIKNINDYKKNREKLLKYLTNPPTDSHLILVQPGKIDFKTSFYKNFKGFEFLFESKKLKENEVVDWIIKRFAQNKIKIDQSNALILFNYIGNDLFDLYSEIEKITILAENKPITKEFLENVVFKNRTYNIYDLINTLHVKNFQMSLKIALSLYNSNEKLLYILSQIINYYLNIFYLEGMQKKLSKKEIALQLKSHEFYLKGYEEAARKYPKKELIKILDMLLIKDIELKTSQSQDITILITLFSEIQNICQK